MMFLRVFVLPLLLLCSGTLALAQNAAPADNVREGCVTDFDPTVDYFPDKVEIVDAAYLSVTYFNHYKVVSVLNAYDGAEPFAYVLVQCGTPAPALDDFPPGTQMIEVPTGRLITLSTTQLPHLVQLDLLEQLAGVDSFLYINTPEVRALIDEGRLVEVGFGAGINVEQVLELEPGLVMTYGFNPDTDAHPKLLEAGIFTALNAEWREITPLGRAEWLKYTALFYNAEAQANAVYDDIVSAYTAARDLAATIPADERPVVLWNAFDSFSSAWIIPGAETFIGRLIEDAGGRIALGDQAPQDSAFLSFEVVYDGALDADLWVTNLFAVSSADDLLAQDSRYADFAAFQNGAVWNSDADVNENGGNNFYELGVTSPHLVLLDLVALFHPELLPDHAQRFFRPMTAD